jgi:mannosyltransferase OCH1-like enzyme
MKRLNYESMLPDVALGSEIPKVVHHIFFGDRIPDELRNNVDLLLSNNPEYDHNFLDDSNATAFIKKHYNKHVLERFNRLNVAYPAIRSDFLRYLVVYAVGGIYLDLKSLFTTKINDALLGDEAFILCQWENGKGEEHETFGLRWVDNYIDGGDYEQWHVISVKGHPFLRAVIIEVMRRIDNYRLWREGTGRTAVFYLTGPHTYSDAIYPIRDLHSHKFYRRGGDAKLQFSCMPGMAHADANKNHYSKVHTALVEPQGSTRIAYIVFRAYQLLRRKVVKAR